MNVPFLDLKAQYAPIRPEIDEAVGRVFDSCGFALGPTVADFERDFAAYCGGVEHCAGVNSGTSALHLALLAAGVGPGDEVITVPYTFVATIAAICYTGARPVLVDIDPASYTLDVTQLEQAITDQTKAIMPVHLYGQPADMDPILEVARARGLVVIEDAAQAHGAEYKGRRVGSLGDMGCFSFYPGKNLGAAGEGGAVTTNNAEFDETIRMLRDWGQDRKYHHVLKGFNARLEGIQGAVLGVKLKHLDAWTEARRRHAATYDRALADAGVTTPAVMPWTTRHAYHLYTILAEDREGLAAALQEQGIGTGMHYPIPVHLQPAYEDLGYTEGDFPVAENVATKVLSLPMFAELADEQVEAVARAVVALRP